VKDSLYTLIYSALLGTLCAVLLTATSAFCKPRQEANEKAEIIRNKLSVLGVTFDPKASAETLIQLYDSSVADTEYDGLDTFVYPKEGTPKAIGVPIEGPGLWGPIHGFMSLDGDLSTIRAVSFYKQEETPGLGGEISTPGFQKQFEGKTIDGLHFVRGKKAQKTNEIDAISGATLTCNKIQKMIDQLADRLKSVRAAKQTRG